MKNSKFIIYNKTKSLRDFDVFVLISSHISKGLLSANKTKYCYLSRYSYGDNIVFIETKKQKYGYKIIAFEEDK